MPVVPLTIHLPAALWQAVQALAPHEGDPTTVILRAVEECACTAAMPLDAHTIVGARSHAIRRLSPSSGAPTETTRQPPVRGGPLRRSE